jgi:hypothetical protein
MAAGSNKDCMHHSALAMLAKSIAKQDKSQTASKTNEWSSARHVGLQDNVLHSVGRFALSAPNHQCGTYILCNLQFQFKLNKNCGFAVILVLCTTPATTVPGKFQGPPGTSGEIRWASGQVPGTSGDLRGNCMWPPGNLQIITLLSCFAALNQSG